MKHGNKPVYNEAKHFSLFVQLFTPYSINTKKLVLRVLVRNTYGLHEIGLPLVTNFENNNFSVGQDKARQFPSW